MQVVEELNFSQWIFDAAKNEQLQAVNALESGRILVFPQLSFQMAANEKKFLTLTPSKAKNISYNIQEKQVRGIASKAEVLVELQQFLSRFSENAMSLVQQLFLGYKNNLEIGLASLRTVEAQGRVSTSYRQDDTRLHVDAFPSRPMQGKRILRVFCNVNPDGKPRVWHAGEPFEKVAKRFGNQFKHSPRWLRQLKCHLRITRGFQTLYDSFMLQLHHAMKNDSRYQSAVAHHVCEFFPGTTWIVFSDQVSHAVISGQHLLEQTFYLPVDAMHDKARSPLAVLEHLTGRRLLD